MLGPGGFGPCLGRGLDLGHCRSQPDDPPSVRSAWSCSGRCHPLPDRATSPSPHLSPFSAPPPPARGLWLFRETCRSSQIRARGPLASSAWWPGCCSAPRMPLPSSALLDSGPATTPTRTPGGRAPPHAPGAGPPTPADRTPGPPSADVVSQARVLMPLKQDCDSVSPLPALLWSQAHPPDDSE